MNSQPTIELRTKRLVLRPITQDDLPAIVAGCSDPLVARFIPLPVPYTSADGREWIATAPQRWLEGREVSFALSKHGENVCVGIATARLRDGGSVGYWLARSARGEGLMTEAVAALIDWADREHAVRRGSLLFEWTAPKKRLNDPA
jgi:RimJ/RimL family protein N-acetyltransferase